MAGKHEEAIFAAGCFWGVEESFANVEGVLSTEVGYTGGHKVDPTYEEVCRGDTGHAEAVRIRFDPERVSYESLVNHFFDIHDPTTSNRQGPDVGHQYRSAVFTLSSDQERTALRVKDERSSGYRRPIVTEVTGAGPFYRAEEYHQRYLAKRGLAYCHV